MVIILEILRDWGVTKAKLSWSFQKGAGEGQTKNHRWGGHGYFILEPNNTETVFLLLKIVHNYKIRSIKTKWFFKQEIFIFTLFELFWFHLIMLF